MSKDLKITKIREAFEEFAKKYKYAQTPIQAKVINEFVQDRLDFKLTMKVSDFAEPECSKSRAYGNKELFVRQRKGYYLIKQ